MADSKGQGRVAVRGGLARMAMFRGLRRGIRVGAWAMKLHRARTVALLLGLMLGRSAGALDKQGSGAHGGTVAGAETGFDFTGALTLGVSVYNPSYAARPDNTGRTLFRYAIHADIDLIGRRLSIPLDINFFTDGDRDGGGVMVPSEFDVITGATSTWGLGEHAAFEGGVRIEHDRPVDRGGSAQTYADVRGRFLGEIPGKAFGLAGHDLSGWLTVGWFAYNRPHTSTYFARPDNTGRALLRYAAHGSMELIPNRLTVAVDGTFFTDSRAANVMRPSELDLTPELILSLGTTEVHLAYERDMPLDRAGIKQEFVYILAQVAFDLIDDAEPVTPLRRTTAASP